MRAFARKAACVGLATAGILAATASAASAAGRTAGPYFYGQEYICYYEGHWAVDIEQDASSFSCVPVQGGWDLYLYDYTG